MFFFCFSFFLWVGSFSPSPLTSGGPPQCLNSGPGSEPGVNRGLGSLFWGYASNLSYFPFLFSLCFRPVPRLKDTHCSGQYLFWGHSSAFYYTGSPSLCWPLASSGSSGIPTSSSRPRPLAFLRPEPLQGWQYSWQVLRLAEPDLKLKGEVELLEIIREEVRVEHFFRPFRGNFKGKAYDSDMPPPVVIKSRPP